jgi:hypothetical protein
MTGSAGIFLHSSGGGAGIQQFCRTRPASYAQQARIKAGTTVCEAPSGRRIDSFADAGKSTREAEFSMRGQISAILMLADPGVAAGPDGARMPSVPFTAKTTSKTTAKTV